MQRILLALLLIAPVLAATNATAQTGCTRVPTRRAVPGGDTLPAFRLVCEESPDDRLLDSDAAQLACASSALPPERVDDCEEAVSRAEAARRKARLRAALREGTDDDALRQRFDASAEDLDRLRESALRSAAPEP